MRFLCLLLLASCGADSVSNGGFEIDCGGKPCDWVFVEGDGRAAPGWHDDDPAAALGPGHVVVEQRNTPVSIPVRELVLHAAIACDADATVKFELAWFEGSTLLDTRPVEIDRTGVFALKKLVSTPSLAVDGLVLRVIKDGSGNAIVDEVKLEPYYP
jgi:hypothetical protein